MNTKLQKKILKNLILISMLCFTILSGKRDVSASSGVYGTFTYEEYTNSIAITGYTGDDSIVTIPDKINSKSVTRIEDDAFYQNSVITEVKLPNTIVSIGESSFYECTNLISINFPEGLKYIEISAFSGAGLTSVSFPSTLKSINYAAFLDCKYIEKFYCSGITEGGFYTLDDVLYQGNKLRLYPASKNSKTFYIPDGTYGVYMQAFSSVQNLETVVIPESVRSISNEAFTDGGNQYRAKRTFILKHTSVESDMKIYSYAFSHVADGTKIIVNNEEVKEWVENGAPYSISTDYGTVSVVVEPKPATSLTLEETSIRIKTGSTYALSYSQLPYDNTSTITWTSSDTSLVTVDKYSGNLQAADNKSGSCTVTGTDTSGNTVKCNVTVYQDTENICITTGGTSKVDSISIQKNNSAILEAYILPLYASTDSITWSVDDESIATIEVDSENPKNCRVVYQADGKTKVRVSIKNSNGTILTDTVEVYNRPFIDIADISLSQTSYSYTGSAIKPSVTVKIGNAILVKDTDYTVSYSNNTEVGEATITVTGIGNYRYSQTVTFNIVKNNTATGNTETDVKNIKNATIKLQKTKYTYTGSAIKPSVTVTYNGTTLVKNRDYKVSYKNNTNAGNGTVIITGIGNYTGTLEKKFTISKVSVSKLSFKLSKSTMTYTGSALKPGCTVKFGKTALKKSSDYTITYTSNKNVGTAKVTIKGKNNFTGTKTLTFKIKPRATALKVKSSKKKQVSVTITKRSEATGYVVYRSTSKNGKYSAVKTIKNSKTVKFTDKKSLKSKKTYYYKVRSYKVVNGKRIYSDYSKVIKVTTK